MNRRMKLHIERGTIKYNKQVKLITKYHGNLYSNSEFALAHEDQRTNKTTVRMIRKLWAASLSPFEHTMENGRRKRFMSFFD